MPKKNKRLEQNSDNSEKLVFAEGLCFRKLFFVFLIGSVIGSLYEELLHLAQVYFASGTLEWSLRRGVIYGPFNVIYGFGAALMVWLLARKKYNGWQVFLFSALLGGFFEYIMSFLQEMFIHTTSWDYSSLFLNINGRTTVPIMIVWGIMGYILIKKIYPLLSKIIESIPYEKGEIAFRVLLVFMILNMLISWTALFRQTLRHNNIPPFTPIDQFYDSYYNDERLRHYFPNMNRASGE